MESRRVPAPQQETSGDLLCDLCHVRCDSRESLNAHYRERAHLDQARCWGFGLFGLRSMVTNLQHLYIHSSRRGTFIGLQYLRITVLKPGPFGRRFSCTLCGVTKRPLFQHLLSKEHKAMYIAKHFSFLFENVESFSPRLIEDIAIVIERVEGFETFKLGAKNCNEEFLDCPGRASTSVNLSRQNLDKMVDLLKKKGISYKNPYGTGNEIPCLQTESHVSETNEKKDVNTTVPSEKSAVSEIASRQIDDKISDKPQMHGIELKDAGRKENDMPRLQAGSRDFALNVNSGKRPLGFAPFAESKGCKKVHSHNVPPVNQGMVPKPISPLFSSHKRRWVYETTWPPAGGYSPSWPPAVSCYQNAKHEYGYSDQSLYEFANKSAYEQARSVSDFGKANAFEGQAWCLGSGHPGAQHLHTLEATDGSISSVDGPSSSVASVQYDTLSRNGYNSVDGKELFSKSFSPSRIDSVLSQDPSLSQSLGDSCPPEYSLPTTSTSSPAQTPQIANSNMPAKAASMLSPHTLKILQGRGPESVKSILTRLAEYCPELQQVNISLLVDVLFEAGALR